MRMIIKYKCCICGSEFLEPRICMKHESECEELKVKTIQQYKDFAEEIKYINNEIY